MKKKIYSFIFSILLCFSLGVTIFANSSLVVSAADTQCLYDEADLLTDSEENILEEKLADISDTYGMQIVIATVDSTGDADIDEFLEYSYDSMGFGYGATHDGVYLLVCMDSREYRILSNGLAADAIGTNEIDILCGFMDTYLPNGYYSLAFDEFADQCAYYINGYLNGFPFDAGSKLATSLIIGVIAGVIVAFVLKGQLKSVRKQRQANVYVKAGSMQITNRRDIFLYRDVSRTKKESSSKSSSSGSSRNTGGGSF